MAPGKDAKLSFSTNNGLQTYVHGLVHNLLVQFFALGSSNIEGYKTYFLDVVATQKDHPSYGKHILGSICVFSTLFGYLVGGDGLPMG